MSKRKALLPVVLERKLEAIIVHIEAIAEVHPSAPLKLASDGDTRDRVVEQVRECIVTLMEVRWLLGVDERAEL